MLPFDAAGYFMDSGDLSQLKAPALPSDECASYIPATQTKLLATHVRCTLLPSCVQVLRTIRLLRLIKLLRVLRSMRVLRRIENELAWTHVTFSLIQYCAATIILLHWFACFWNIVPQARPAALLL